MSVPYDTSRGEDIEAASTAPSGSGSGHTEKKYGVDGYDNKEGEATLHAAGGEAYIDAEKAQDVRTPKFVVDGEGECRADLGKTGGSSKGVD